MKVSATDWVDGGWDLEQTVAFSRELKKRGADWVTASSAGISPLQKIALGASYQDPFAKGIKDAVDINTVAVGLITDAQQAEAIVSSGKADLVALARGILYDPRWGWHAAAQLGGTENAALRHQLIVLQRRVRGRVQLTNGDRLFLVLLYRWFPSVLKLPTKPARG